MSGVVGVYIYSFAYIAQYSPIIIYNIILFHNRIKMEHFIFPNPILRIIIIDWIIYICMIIKF